MQCLSTPDSPSIAHDCRRRSPMNIQEVQMNPTEFEAVVGKCSYLGVTREYLDICEGDWPRARLLSAIIYWFRPGANGDGRAVKFRYGMFWVYKTAKEWRWAIDRKSTRLD